MTRRNPLAETLAKIRAATADWFTRDNDKLVAGLIASDAASGALKVGDRLPDFMLPNAEGVLINSKDIFGAKPVIVSFYRGMWCPYCSAELNALAEVSPRLQQLGAGVLAITPEIGGLALKTKKERDLDFEILCDVDNGVAMDCGLMFRIPDDIQPSYLKFNVDLPKVYGNDSWMIPIPATYVVGKDGVITHAYVNPDYRDRLDPETLLDVIPKLV
ncbi:MAG TPA: peroxiredoxin-like family protein [Rhizomicrobium sp.]|jgi:peroxiredoxin|nr:peroxiredoxin-like family protein [Rhizomicrobium sp.]